MSDQASDLPRPVQIIGRYRTLVGITTLLGLLAGVVFAWLNAPGYTSNAVVVLTAPACPAAGAICGGPAFSAGSIQAGSLTGYPSGVQITAVTDSVVSISATAKTAAQAEATANAAARSYVASAGFASNMGERPAAQVLTPATTATGTTPAKHVLGDALLGAVFGVLVGVIAALAGGRTIIDPPTVPKGLDVGEGDWGAGQQTGYTFTPPGFDVGDPYGAAGQQAWYASNEVSLDQMARAYVAWRAAREDESAAIGES